MNVRLAWAREDARRDEHGARTLMRDVPVAGDSGATDHAVLQRRKAVEDRAAIAERPFDARGEVGLAPDVPADVLDAAVMGRYAHVRDSDRGPRTWAEYQWILVQAELDVVMAQHRLLRLRRETGPCGLVDDEAVDLPADARYAAGGSVSAAEVSDRLTGRLVARYPYGEGGAAQAGRLAADLVESLICFKQAEERIRLLLALHAAPRGLRP